MATKPTSLSRRQVLAGASGSLLLGDRASAAGRRLRLGHGLAAHHPVHAAMERFAELVRDRSGGEFEIQVFAGGVIGEERDLLAQLRAGRLDLTKTSATVLEDLAPRFGVFNLPFLMRDKAHYRTIVNGPVGEAILTPRDGDPFVPLTFYDAGARNFYGRSLIKQAHDLEGLVIRVHPATTMVRMIELLEGKPVTMAWGLVYEALRNHLIDGAENNVTALTLGRHGEVAKHYALTEHTFVPDVLMASKALWARLDVRQRAIFKEVALVSASFHTELWTRSEREARAAAEHMGVLFTSVDKRSFAERTAVMRQPLEASPLSSWLAQIERA